MERRALWDQIQLGGYGLAVQTYGLLIQFAALFHPKAAAWKKGRDQYFERLIKQVSELPDGQNRIWFHCASLGEFEQGRPIIEDLKAKHPALQIILSFFSPSGFEIQKGYKYADLVTYIPLDNKSNARQFIQTIAPDIAIFVKYDFWPNLIWATKETNAKLILISGIFRPGQWFLQPVLSIGQKMLQKFDQIFVQNQESKDILVKRGLPSVEMVGDTRVDRVLGIKEAKTPIPLIEQFLAGSKNVLIVGSSWPEDEAVLLEILEDPAFSSWKFIIAPHEIKASNILRLQQTIPISSCQFSKPERILPTDRVLILDTIGHLSKAYQYAKVAFVGGGFGKGIHNILEPTVFGIPVLFGPNYKKFQEAILLRDRQIAFPLQEKADLKTDTAKYYST